MAELSGHIRFSAPGGPLTQRDGDTHATWDPERRTLNLVRDRLGTHPLYYFPTADGVLFSATLDRLLEHRTPVLDRAGLLRALAFTLSVPGVPWAGMQEVAPGTVVTITPERTTTRVYWRPRARPHPHDLAETVAVIRNMLAARARGAALLSGGLDSSLLAALAGPGLRTYDLDFADHAAHFTADNERAAPDTPYATMVAAHLGTSHRTITLDPVSLADPALRRTVVKAYGTPPGWGDRDRSAYLLYHAIREHDHTVLSGEAADELFGGYATFFDPAIHQAATFPWVATGYAVYGPAPGALRPELGLDLPAHLAGEYARAVREVEHLEGEPDARMRTVAYLYLTRALPVILTRKAAVSRAAGLGVGTPFADHRLAEYVLNIPWSMKTFDGREKSLLRAAARDLLPAPVLRRVKSAYPTTRHPAYLAALAEQAADLAATPGHPVFEIVSDRWLASYARRTGAPRVRNTLEWILNLAACLDLYRPTLRPTR